MPNLSLPEMEERIARCRLAFSALVTTAVLVDPFQPARYPWLTGMSQPYPLLRSFVATIVLHLIYSTVVYVGVRRSSAFARLAWLTTSADILFAGAISFITEGRSTLFYPFFSVPLFESALRWGLRRTLLVSTASAALGIAMIAVWAPDGIAFYLVRPLYLLIIGYLLGYLGEQRLALESNVRVLEANEQRLRLARDLHDGCVQVLAAVNLQLESCQKSLLAGRTDELLTDLRDLQRSVNSEHDELRGHLRSLAGVPASAGAPASSDPRIHVRLDLEAPGAVIDQVLRIVREGITNIRRHAGASSAEVLAATDTEGIHIAIDDDGRGLVNATQLPWSILSRVRELGGSLSIAPHAGPGAHLSISLPPG